MQLTEVKERPILFSTSMVQAILEGRKTQTRRIVKDKHMLGFCNLEGDQKLLQSYLNELAQGFSPYGKVGDTLWVRETWCKGYTINRDDERSDMRYYYKADTDWQEHEWDHPTKEGPQDSPIWKPSIFMKKEACRIFLEITDIRIERLQDISEEDAQAEGAAKMSIYDLGNTWQTYKRGFQSIWEKINGEDSWNSNPFCWVISFKKK